MRDARRTGGVVPRSKSHRERDDNYDGVIAVFPPLFRIALCRDSLQWVVQRRDGERSGRPRWKGVSYCLTRDGLLQASRTLCGALDAVQIAAILSLPENVTDAGGEIAGPADPLSEVSHG